MQFFLHILKAETNKKQKQKKRLKIFSLFLMNPLNNVLYTLNDAILLPFLSHKSSHIL